MSEYYKVTYYKVYERGSNRQFKCLTWMTRYLWGSRAIRVNSTASSLNLGRLSASIIQPEIIQHSRLIYLIHTLNQFKHTLKKKKSVFTLSI